MKLRPFIIILAIVLLFGLPFVSIADDNETLVGNAHDEGALQMLSAYYEVGGIEHTDVWPVPMLKEKKKAKKK